MNVNRRDFLKLGATGVAATIVMGTRIPFLGMMNAYAAGSQTLEVTITDAMKQMVTHNEINDARCYFWVYQMTLVDSAGNRTPIPVDCPGPTIYAVNGDTITLKITNALDVPHSFFIPGIFDSGIILPGQTITPLPFTVTKSGAHLYYDNLNEPVNRVMGLHGALVVRPAAAAVGHNFTPYDVTPANLALGRDATTGNLLPGGTKNVQRLYDMLGTPFWPGLKWEEGDPDTNTPPFRQYVWLYHQASPKLQAAVGNFTATNKQNYDAKTFLNQFLRDPFSPTRNNNKPEFFTINGQSGFFSHFIPAITPVSRVGEPVVIHILNAGLQTHSHHMHCNHFFVTSHNNIRDLNPVPHPNPIWVDIYGIKSMERIDYTFPFMRPPDTPNSRGIGRPDAPLKTAAGLSYWPPQEEMQTHFPAALAPGVLPTSFAQDGVTPVEMQQRLSPLCYPAHDHLETSQTAQGGNYNQGLISGAYIFGDRNAQSQGLGNWMNFPMDADFFQMFRNIRGLAVDGVNGTREAAGPRTKAG